MLIGEVVTPTFDIEVVKTAISTALQPFTANLTVTNVAVILGLVLSLCLALYLFYWGARKGLGMLKGSFSGGKLRF
ncbi:MAG: hypothetical protein IJY87_04600 [Bacilli bacterium]|nr:hypothetical protein [Bacilli bacterium]